MNKPLTPRLYNLDQDIGERYNVAGGHPEIVQRLMGYIREMDGDLGVNKNGPGVRDPGRVDHPQGLWLPGQMPEEKPYQPSDLLHVGDEIEAYEAPQIAGKPLRITCQITPKSENAVIVTQGGKQSGYSLYLTDGVPSFAVRENKKLYTVAAPSAPGKTYGIEARLEKGGRMTLAIDDKIVAKGKAAGLFKKQPAESMCVGFNDGAPVITDTKTKPPIPSKAT